MLEITPYNITKPFPTAHTYPHSKSSHHAVTQEWRWWRWRIWLTSKHTFPEPVPIRTQPRNTRVKLYTNQKQNPFLNRALKHLYSPCFWAFLGPMSTSSTPKTNCQVYKNVNVDIHIQTIFHTMLTHQKKGCVPFYLEDTIPKV